jgi:hypothetical protein
MKLNLLKKERIELETKGTITVERENYMNVPLCSVHYGTGRKQLWDKVDRVWIYGDTDQYIKDYMNVGRRKKDYPDNTKNVWSGGYWWDCHRELSDYDNTDKPMTNGIKNPITFKITNIVLDRLAEVRVKDCTFTNGLPKDIDPETVVYKRPVLKYTISF